MTTAGQPTGYFNQTYAIEFEVADGLDGVTPSPNVQGSPPSGQNPNDSQNLFRIPVETLGLINPDYALPDQDDPNLGTTGLRMVTFLWIEGSSPGAADASVDIVDAVDGTPRVQKAVGTFIGDTEFYREGIFVPQGSMIRVRGMTGPVKVRLHIQFLNNARDIAKVLAAICCIEGGGGGGPGELAVQANGLLVALTSILNFTGNVNVANDPPNNRVNVEVLGGGPILTRTFLDNGTVDLVVGSVGTVPPPGTITVDANISDVTGKSTAYRFTIGVSPTGAAIDCMQVDAGTAPILDIVYTALIAGTNVVLRLAGSGAGVQSAIAYQVVRTLPRLLP